MASASARNDTACRIAAHPLGARNTSCAGGAPMGMKVCVIAHLHLLSPLRETIGVRGLSKQYLMSRWLANVHESPLPLPVILSFAKNLARLDPSLRSGGQYAGRGGFEGKTKGLGGAFPPA